MIHSKIGTAAALTALLAAAHPARAQADLQGVWAIAKPTPALLTNAGTLPPLTKAGLDIYQQNQAALAKGDRRSWDPVAKCKPPGEPRTYTEMNWPFELFQSKNRIDFLFQWNRLDRAIPVLAKQIDDPDEPFYFGQSVAQWEGKTLKVEVENIKPNTFLDDAGLPHSDNLTIVETWRLRDPDTLVGTFHFVDPTIYSSAWDATMIFKRQPAGTRIKEDSCTDRTHSNDYATIDNAIVR